MKLSRANGKPDFFDGKAKWIWSTEGIWGASPDPRPIQCRYFARDIELKKGERFVLAITADTRYMLYVNGKIAARGPQKGDVCHQFYDTLELSDSLHEGENRLLVRVDSNAKTFPDYPNTGPSGSEMSQATVFAADGFILNENGEPKDRIVTDGSWRVMIDPAIDFRSDYECPSFVGFKETVDLSRLPKDFHASAQIHDAPWENATEIKPVFRPDTMQDPSTPHIVLPRSIAPMHLAEYGFKEIKDAGTEASRAQLADDGHFSCKIPAGKKFRCILDAGCERTAYPVLKLGKAKGAKLRLKYAECLFKDGNKINRDTTEGCEFIGYSDFITGGDTVDSWSTIHWRAFRYIELSVEAAEEDFEITDLHFIDCHYPIFPAGEFSCSDEKLDKMWSVGIRTQQACAHDTFEDCPYYEQLQYAGDAQMQMMFTYAVSGVTDLPRQTIRFFNWSQTEEGLTQSRYPSRPRQFIPFWSLHYLYMLHDWYMYTADAKEIRREILDSARVVRWFTDRIDESGLIGALSYWCVADWSPEWHRDFKGRVPGWADGPTALTNFMLIAAMEKLSVLYGLIGESATASELSATAANLKEKAHKAFWDPSRKVYRDTLDMDVASQLTNAWALLIDLPEAGERAPLAETIATDKSLCQAAYFGHFYVFQALNKLNRPDLVVNEFSSYKDLLDLGITTWPESTSPNTRSDCHAWSNAATYGLLSTVLGISIAEPGCTKMNISPYMNGLDFAKGSFATPHGAVSVEFDRKAGKVAVSSPKEIAISFCGKDLPKESEYTIPFDGQE